MIFELEGDGGRVVAGGIVAVKCRVGVVGAGDGRRFGEPKKESGSASRAADEDLGGIVGVNGADEVVTSDTRSTGSGGGLDSIPFDRFDDSASEAFNFCRFRWPAEVLRIGAAAPRCLEEESSRGLLRLSFEPFLP